MTDDVREKVQQQFIDRCKTQAIQYNSKTFKKMQVEFFSGAMSILVAMREQIDPRWTVCLLVNRNIVNY